MLSLWNCKRFHWNFFRENLHLSRTKWREKMKSRFFSISPAPCADFTYHVSESCIYNIPIRRSKWAHACEQRVCILPAELYSWLNSEMPSNDWCTGNYKSRSIWKECAHPITWNWKYCNLLFVFIKLQICYYLRKKHWQCIFLRNTWKRFADVIFF